MNSYHFTADDEKATDRLGAALAQRLPNGTTVALCGTLGAGKTRLVQAVAKACGMAGEDITSPTFVLCQEYHGDRTIYHMDAYRIADDDEFLQIGAEEYFASSGITFVEWADRVRDCLPPDRIEIKIKVTGETSREFEISSVGEKYHQIIETFAV